MNGRRFIHGFSKYWKFVQEVLNLFPYRFGWAVNSGGSAATSSRRASPTTTRCRRWTRRASGAGGDGARATISRSACGTSGRRRCASRATPRSDNQQPGGARSAAAQDPAEDFRLLPKRGRRGGPSEPEDDAGDGAHAGLEPIGDAGGRPGGGFDQAEDIVAGRLRLHAPEFRPKDAERSYDGRIST